MIHKNKNKMKNPACVKKHKFPLKFLLIFKFFLSKNKQNQTNNWQSG